MSDSLHNSNSPYERLQTANTIRLLDILPGSFSEHIRGNIRHVNIDSEEVVFDALSYAWGTARYTRALECTYNAQIPRSGETNWVKSGRVFITPSLEEAHRHIRSSTCVRTIWADGICINQRDVQERGHQIKIMGDIYRKAKTVLVWLGPDVKNSAAMVFHYIRSHESPIIPKTTHELWSPLVDLTNCSWFERLWVVQEVILARRAKVHWGTEQIDFEDIVRAISSFLNHPRSHSRYISRDTLRWVSELKDHFSTDARRDSLISRSLTGSGIDLFELIQWTRALKCSDDIDRIYAILGLSYAGPPGVEDFINSLEPDYTKTANQVYLEFAHKAISNGWLPRVLGAVQHGPTLQPLAGVPHVSWTPQWNIVYASDFRHVKFGSSHPHGDFHKGYISSEPGGLEWCLQFNGTFIDNIFSSSEDSLYFEPYGIDLGPVAQFWTSNIKSRVSTGSGVSAGWYNLMFCQALVAGYQYRDEGFEAVENAASYVIDLCEKQANVWGIRPAPKHKQEAMYSSIFQSFLSAFPDRKSDVPFSNHIFQRSLKGRRLFMTSHGLVGLGPEALRKNDFLIELEGSNSLFVLRRVSQFRQRLVGSAYIPPAMIEEHKKSDSTDSRRFKLI